MTVRTATVGERAATTGRPTRVATVALVVVVAVLSAFTGLFLAPWAAVLPVGPVVLVLGACAAGERRGNHRGRHGHYDQAGRP